MLREAEKEESKEDETFTQELQTAHVTTSDAYRCYQSWAAGQGIEKYKKLHQQEFSAEMQRRYKKKRMYLNSGRPDCYCGVELK